jgi:glycogen synthase
MAGAHEAQERAIDRADRLIALTRSEADLIAAYYPHAQNKVRVVGNGIEDSSSSWRSAFQKPRRARPLIAYCGRLVERKGIRELLAALPEILRAFPDSATVIVGGPPPLAGPEVAAQWLGPEHAPFCERIHFTGWQSPDNVAKWYEAADILVVPSRYEPFGMVILEGMLYGLAVVAANVGGPSEIIQHRETGLLFTSADVEGLSGAVRWLLAHPRERVEIGKAAALRVRQHWLWETKIHEMLRVYGELIQPLQVAAA